MRYALFFAVLLTALTLLVSSSAEPAAQAAASCRSPEQAIKVVYSRDKYPHIIRHIKASWRKGYPKVLRINRPGADERRDQLLAGIPTREGYDRDEAPAAVLRKRVKASVRYVPSSENRSAGAVLGNTIEPYCDGVKVRYRFVP